MVPHSLPDVDRDNQVALAGGLWVCTSRLSSSDSRPKHIQRSSHEPQIEAFCLRFLGGRGLKQVG